MTRPYAEVIGDPISHSKSPLIHNHWLKKAGIDAEYRACRVQPNQLGAYIELRRTDPFWRGCNVTLPHKIAVMAHVDDPGDIHGSIGAMNTVARGENGTLFGTNTDAGGFFMPVADLALSGEQAIVIGTGGAARAILFALSRCDIGDVTILARNPLAGAALLARFGLKGSVKAIGASLPDAALLVNTTSLGMAGQPPLVIDVDALSDRCVVYDIVYTPLITPLMAAGQKRGLEVIGGLDMLIGQARIAFEIFFDAVPPDDDNELLELLCA